jgi:hypothetical protein
MTPAYGGIAIGVEISMDYVSKHMDAVSLFKRTWCGRPSLKGLDEVQSCLVHSRRPTSTTSFRFTAMRRTSRQIPWYRWVSYTTQPLAFELVLTWITVVVRKPFPDIAIPITIEVPATVPALAPTYCQTFYMRSS